jgi:ABC transporter substrate binding protein
MALTFSPLLAASARLRCSAAGSFATASSSVPLSKQVPARSASAWGSIFSPRATADAPAGFVAAFSKGLGETGYVEGQNVTIEYHWLEGQFDRLPALMADLVRRRVAVIATPANPRAAVVAKAATATIPIVFGVGDDPVKLGLVTSLARPGGNATGYNGFAQELVAKRLGLLHELVPKAVRVAVLVNPGNASSAETTSREVQEAAHAIGLQIDVLNASTSREIDAAFATLARERPDVLFVQGDALVKLRDQRNAPGMLGGSLTFINPVSVVLGYSFPEFRAVILLSMASVSYTTRNLGHRFIAPEGVLICLHFVQSTRLRPHPIPLKQNRRSLKSSISSQ